MTDIPTLQTVKHNEAVVKIIETVFIPAVIVELHSFIQQYKKQIVFATQYKDMTGYDIATPTIVLDFGVATKVLIDNLNQLHANKTN